MALMIWRLSGILKPVSGGSILNNKIPLLAGFVVRSWYWLRRHYQKDEWLMPHNILYKADPNMIAQ